MTRLDCPACGTKHDAATAVKGAHASVLPEGSAVLCAVCCTWGIVEDGVCRRATPAEVADIPVNERRLAERVVRMGPQYAPTRRTP